VNKAISPHFILLLNYLTETSCINNQRRELNSPSLFHTFLAVAIFLCYKSLDNTSKVQIFGKDTKGKGKAVPLQAWSGPDGSRKLRFPDFMTTVQDGGRVVNLTHRPPLPPGNTPGTHFCKRLSRPQGHSATRSIMSLKNTSDNTNR